MKASTGLLLLLVGACGGGGNGDGGGFFPDASPPQNDVPMEERRTIDLLFVVDDSNSMLQEQQALASALPGFITGLAGPSLDLPSLHIGVISSNVGTAPEETGNPQCEGSGDDGHLLVADGCPALDDLERFMRDEVDHDTGERTDNYAGGIADQFGCMVGLGVGGCGFEQHLESMKRALENTTENAGFRRPDAHLAVVILADEDDCSASDTEVFTASQNDPGTFFGDLSSYRCFEFGVACAEDAEGERAEGTRTGCVPDEDSDYIARVSSYADFLRGQVGDAQQVVVATITAPPTPVVVEPNPEQDQIWLAPSCVVCPDGTGSGCSLNPTDENAALVAAAPAIRLHALADAFGGRARKESICSFDAQTQSLDFSLDGVAELVRAEAVTRCLDAAAVDEEVCRVYDLVGDAQTDVPWCGDGDGTCARLVEAAECPAGSALVVDRAEPAASGTTIALRCP